LPASPPPNPSCPEPASRSGFSLAQERCPGVTVPDLSSSTPHWTFTGFVRPVAPSLMPVSPGVGDLNTACPLPDSGPAIPIPPRARSPLGLSSPPDQRNSITATLPARMPGSERRRRRSARRFACALPPFRSDTSLPANSPARALCLEPASRSGFSLARETIPGVPVPDLLLRRLAERSSGPFGLWLHR